jgi:hypothetical protein
MCFHILRALALVLLCMAPVFAQPTADPVARLDDLRRHFAERGRSAAIAELENIAEEARGTEVAGEAHAWLGALAMQAGALDDARGHYEAAALLPGQARCLGLRGLGDLAAAQGATHVAHRRFEEALVACPVALHGELRQKLTAVARARGHRRATGAALAIVGCTLALLGWRVRRARRRGPLTMFPRVLIFVLPIYGLFVLGASTKGPTVLAAISVLALSSLVLTWGAENATADGNWSRGVAVVQAVLVASANLAVLYLVLVTSGLLGPLLESVGIAMHSE